MLIVRLICAGIEKLDDGAPQRERRMGPLDPKIWLPCAVFGLAWAVLAVASVLLSQPWCPVPKTRSVFSTTTVRLRNVAQRTAMSMPQASGVHRQHTTPPSSFAEHPLTPPPTDEKPFTQAHRVVALFKDIRAGKHTKQDLWRMFQLASGEYREIQRELDQDEPLAQYVKSKIRYAGSSPSVDVS